MYVKIIGYAILGVALILGYVKYIEFTSVFFPIRNIEFTPLSINLKFEDIYFKTLDALKINGWFIPHNNAKYTLLFLHGNAGNLADRLDKIKILNSLGLNMFIIDYRGYGKSQGRPSEKGLYLDAQAAYEYLLNVRKIPSEEIILYGESLGTTATVDLASRCKVKAIILESGFSSGRDMARVVYPFIPNFIFSDRFNSLKKIKGITVPKLFLHSRDDEMIPFRLANKLFSEACEPKYFKELRGSHNSAFIDYPQEYLSAIKNFIDKL